MLINIFGVWLMAANIAYLHDYQTSCSIEYVGDNYKRVSIAQPCKAVAAKINEQIYLMKVN